MGRKPDRIAQEFIAAVRKQYNVEKAILFGSRSRGDALKGSDYDFIIVSPDFAGVFFSQRIAKLYDLWTQRSVMVEPLCYTPEEFAQKSKEIGIVRTAVREGIEI